jgi:uncharacterized protein
VSARLGWLGQVGDYVTLGATWQSKTHMGRFEKYSGLFADGGAFDIPESFGLGIAVRPTKQLTIGVDWQRILYSDVPAVGDGVDSLFAGVPLGAAGGPGFGGDIRIACRVRRTLGLRVYQRARCMRSRQSLAAIAAGHFDFHGGSRGRRVHRSPRSIPLEFLTALLAGVLFGGGLLLSKMCDPQRVLGFLDVAGNWNPALAFTMGGAILVAAPAFLYVRKRHVNLLGEATELPDRLKINAPLIAGSAVFGIGWGLSGICPGPALLLLTGGSVQSLVFVGAVIVGLLAAGAAPRN